MEPIFNLFKVKFAKLDSLIGNTLSRNDRVDVFINLEPVIRKLMSISNSQYTQVCQNNMQLFTSNIINLAAHYRLFFSKHKIYSRVYLYIGKPRNNYLNNCFIDTYRNTYNHNLTKNNNVMNFANALSDSHDIIQIICEYIEGVYYIDSGPIENSLVPMVITKDNENTNKKFIVSTDVYDFQYVNLGFNVIIPKKEESYILDHTNVIRFFLLKNHINDNVQLSPKILPFLLSVLGDKKRDIPKITRMGLITILKHLKKAKENNIITNDTFNITMLNEIIKEDHRSTVLNNFYCTDLTSQYNRLGEHNIFYIIRQLKDKFDTESLKQVNDIYFDEYPIMLLEACSGTNYKDFNNDIFNLKKG